MCIFIPMNGTLYSLWLWEQMMMEREEDFEPPVGRNIHHFDSKHSWVFEYCKSRWATWLLLPAVHERNLRSTWQVSQNISHLNSCKSVCGVQHTCIGLVLSASKTRTISGNIANPKYNSNLSPFSIDHFFPHSYRADSKLRRTVLSLSPTHHSFLTTLDSWFPAYL